MFARECGPGTAVRETADIPALRLWRTTTHRRFRGFVCQVRRASAPGPRPESGRGGDPGLAVAAGGNGHRLQDRHRGDRPADSAADRARRGTRGQAPSRWFRWSPSPPSLGSRARRAPESRYCSDRGRCRALLAAARSCRPTSRRRRPRRRVSTCGHEPDRDDEQPAARRGRPGSVVASARANDVDVLALQELSRVGAVEGLAAAGLRRGSCRTGSHGRGPRSGTRCPARTRRPRTADPRAASPGRRRRRSPA